MVVANSLLRTGNSYGHNNFCSTGSLKLKDCESTILLTNANATVPRLRPRLTLAPVGRFSVLDDVVLGRVVPRSLQLVLKPGQDGLGLATTRLLPGPIFVTPPFLKKVFYAITDPTDKGWD